jgi:hypothetical protein
MSQFQLFDSIQLKEPIQIDPNTIAPIGSPGTIVEIFNNGKAYMVKLFGTWVKPNQNGDFVTSDRTDPESFIETIGIETLYPQQITPAETAHAATY